MKKTILSVAVALVATLGFNAAANTPDNNNSNCTAKTECTGTGKKCDRQQRHNRCFEGLNLTAEQQTKLNAIQKPARPSKEDFKNLSDEQKRQLKSQAREQYLSQVKEILTPEQYAKFTENKTKCQNHKGDKSRKGHDGKGKRNGQKGQNRNAEKQQQQ